MDLSKRITLPKDILPLPIIRQATNYSCGAAALLSILYYWKAYHGNEASTYEDLDISDKCGVSPGKLGEFANKNNLHAEIRGMQTLNNLKDALERGDTTILPIQAWPEEYNPLPWKDTWKEGHYVVLVGMDEYNVFFMDPVIHSCYGYLSKKEFMNRWHDIRDGAKFLQTALYIRGKEKPLDNFPDLVAIKVR